MDSNTHYLKKGATLKEALYTIEGKLGSGGFGITYKAKYEKEVEIEERFQTIKTKASIPVAIKELFIEGKCIRNTDSETISLQSLESGDFVSFKNRFLQEAETLSKFQDVPQVVHVIDYFEENNTAYMIMEFVAGQTLTQLVNESGALAENDTINYISQIAEGLSQVHAQNMLHRDIKPDNIIITPKGNAVLIDFGAARGFVADMSVTQSVILTHGYAPIEQYAEKRKRGPFTDIYALGASMYYCLSGQKPPSIYDRERDENFDVSGASPSTNQVLNKAMAYEGSDRYQDCGDFVRGLESDTTVFIERESKSEEPRSIESIKAPQEKEPPTELIEKQDDKTEVRQRPSEPSTSDPYRKHKIVVIILVLFVIIVPIWRHYQIKDFKKLTQNENQLPNVKKSDEGPNGSNDTSSIKSTNKSMMEKVAVVKSEQQKYPTNLEYLARVEVNGKWEYINKNGEKAFSAETKYYITSDFYEGHAYVALNGKFGYIDKKGNEIIPLKYDFTDFAFNSIYGFSEGLAGVELNNKYGFIDKKGNEAIPLKYDFANRFSEGFANVKLNNKWGYIDRHNQIVLSFKYDYAGAFSEGLAIMKLNGTWGYIDKKGIQVIPCIYDDTRSFTEGFAHVKLNGVWGYVDKKGNEVIPLKYDFTYGFYEGLASVKLNEKYGYIDKKGNEIIPLKYSFADSFSEGLAGVELNGKYGFIDKKGNRIIPIKYDGFTHFSEGLAGVELNGKHGFIDKKGNQIIPLIYDSVRAFKKVE